MSARADGRAPRATAMSPMTTPAAPATAASHRTAVTSAAGGCRENHHGGPPAGLGIPTTAALGPAAETAIMARADAMTQAAEDSERARAGRAETEPPEPLGPPCRVGASAVG